MTGLLKLVEDSHYYVRMIAADALGKIGGDRAMTGLLKLVKDSDSDVHSSAADALGNIAKQHAEKVAPHLPHFLTLIPSESGKEFHRLILVIQTACKYYNYPIRELSPPEATKAKDSAGLTINGNVGNLNTAPVNIKGDQIGTQQNNHPKN